MQKIIQVITSAFAIPDLRAKIIFTATVFVVFRLFAHLPVPGVNIAGANLAGNKALALTETNSISPQTYQNQRDPEIVLEQRTQRPDSTALN